MLADFTPATMQQGDLFADQQQAPRNEALMQVIDRINQGRMGKVYFASRGRDTKEWMIKREQLSPPRHHLRQRDPGGEDIDLNSITSIDGNVDYVT